MERCREEGSSLWSDKRKTQSLAGHLNWAEKPLGAVRTTLPSSIVTNLIRTSRETKAEFRTSLTVSSNPGKLKLTQLSAHTEERTRTLNIKDMESGGGERSGMRRGCEEVQSPHCGYLLILLPQGSYLSSLSPSLILHKHGELFFLS